MNLAFALYTYFPFGGLQKDMLASARKCAIRGHNVTIYCRSWEGDKPGNIPVRILESQSISNHNKNFSFHDKLSQELSVHPVDLLVAFNKIPDADIYYAADTCFKAKVVRERPWFFKFVRRYSSLIKNEEKLFVNNPTIKILSLSDSVIEEYISFYNTPRELFTLLPPGINRNRINLEKEKLDVLREELGIPSNEKILLQIGSGFKTKGIDRSIKVIKNYNSENSNPAHLVVVGQDTPDKFIAQAKKLGVSDKVHFLGGRHDVPELLKSADAYIHPAYREGAGAVLLEAAVSLLPVICTDVCGYSPYIKKYQLGYVCPEPFTQANLDTVVSKALGDDLTNQQIRENGLRFAKEADIYDMTDKILALIESSQQAGV